MKVLLTGGSGQVGREVARLSPHWAELWAPTSTEVDITDAAAVHDALTRWQPDLVINSAAYTAVDRAEQEPGRAWLINQSGPAHLGHAADQIGAAVFHISTDYVFAGDQITPYRETDTPNPLGVYGASKLAGERALTQSLERSLILRTSWVFGATGQNFVKTMLRLGGERHELKVVSDQIGSPTAAIAIARCLWQLATAAHGNPTFQWGTYHFAGTPPCSWYVFAETLFSRALEMGLVDRRPSVLAIGSKDYPTLARRPAFSVLDATLAQQTFGIIPPDWKTDLDAVLAELAAQPSHLR